MQNIHRRELTMQLAGLWGDNHSIEPRLLHRTVHHLGSMMGWYVDVLWWNPLANIYAVTMNENCVAEFPRRDTLLTTPTSGGRFAISRISEGSPRLPVRTFLFDRRFRIHRRASTYKHSKSEVDLIGSVITSLLGGVSSGSLCSPLWATSVDSPFRGWGNISRRVVQSGW